MREIAQEELLEANTILGPNTAIGYRSVVGEPVDAITRAARACAADLIVVPWRRPGRLRSRSLRQIESRLSATGSWEVVVGPDPRLSEDESQTEVQVETTYSRLK